MSTRDFAELRKKSPLTMEGSVNLDDHPTTKILLNLDDGRQKISFPIIDYNHVETTLMCLEEYDEQAKLYHNDHWAYFPQALSATAKRTWKAKTNGMAENQANFDQGRVLMLETIVGNRAMEDFKDYLHAYRKPGWILTADLLNRFQSVMLYLGKLPNATEYTEAQQKRAFVRMFPAHELDQFDRQYSSAGDVDWKRITDFFSTYDTDEPRPNRKSKISAARIRGGKRMKESQHQGKNKKTKNPCRIHKDLANRNHDWSDCIYNAKGPNYNAEKHAAYLAKQGKTYVKNKNKPNTESSTPAQYFIHPGIPGTNGVKTVQTCIRA